MKHPIWDRLLLLLCTLCALCAAAGLIALLVGAVSLDQIIALLGKLSPLMGAMTAKAILAAAAAVCVLLAMMLFSAILPARKKRSSNYAIQRNENGMVRISLKALETLVQKCLNQHAELKVVTSSIYSDEESVRIDIHIAMESDISMPLAISALQKQIKKYLEACSGVMVQEVRIFVESTMPANESTASSAYALPVSILGAEAEALPEADEPQAEAAPVQEEAAEAAEPAEEPACAQEAQQEEAQETQEDAEQAKNEMEETGDIA